MRTHQRALEDILTRRKFGRTNFLKRLLNGHEQNCREDIYALNQEGFLRLHSPTGDDRIERAYPNTWYYIYSLMKRQLELNWHDVGVDDILLAFEIWAKENGVEFEDGSAILKGRHLSLPTKISWPKLGTYEKAIEPDGLFRLGDKYFALEFDRNTEDIYASTFKQKKSWLRTLLQYGDVFENQTHVKEWGIKPLKVLVVTTNPTHMKNIMACLEQDIGHTASGICFLALPVLSRVSSKAIEVDDLLLFDSWQRVGHEPFQLREEVKHGHSPDTQAPRPERRTRPANSGSRARRKAKKARNVQ